MLQHGSYTLLIDSCYDREQFPTIEEAIEWTWASTTEECEAVKFVLRKFFVLEDGVYIQKRIQEEINEYKGKAKINKRIAIEREANRKGNNTNREENNTNRERPDNEPPPNHKPITINHKPILKACVELISTTPAVVELPLNKKGEYHPVTQIDIDELSALYPAVDVLQQLRSMIGWLNACPEKRKTKSGVKRFINSWLSKEQNKGGIRFAPDQQQEKQRKVLN